jgi:hypothetical protein
MAGLVLHKESIHSGLDEVGHVRPPERMEIETGR